MSRRHKKKRNKAYKPEEIDIDTDTDTGPLSSEPVVHRYKAEYRGPVKEWWHEKNRMVKFGAAATAIALIIGWLLFELVRWVF